MFFPEKEPDSVPAPHTSRSKNPFFYNFPAAHDEAEILVARRQGTTQIRVSYGYDTHWPQVITQELASELVNLRVSNIYDLSSVRSIPPAVEQMGIY